MALRPEELAKTIDLTLDGKAGCADLAGLCEQAREHHFASVCVPPDCVKQAAELLSGCDVKVCTVVEDVATAERCVAEGANELEAVLDVQALLAGDVFDARDRLVAIVRCVRMRTVNAGRGQLLLKASVDCASLPDKLKKLACKIVEDAGVDYLVVANEPGLEQANLHDVEVMRDTLSEHVSVKASGWITTVEEAYAAVNAGAARLGTSEGAGIVRGTTEVRQASVSS